MASFFSLGVAAGCGGGSGGTPPPAAASNLAVVSTTSSAVALSWSDNSTDEEGFAVERSAAGGPFAEIGRVGANVTSYDDLGIAADQSYTYRVRSFGAGGEAAPSNDAGTTTYTLDALAAMLAQSLDSLRGDEIPPASTSVTLSGITYTVTFLGFAFCMPPDPWAPPVASPTPPDGVYGCQNSVSVTLTPSSAGDSVTLGVSVPDLYVDCSTDSSLTGTDACYAAFSGVQLTATASLASTPDGRKAIQGPLTGVSIGATGSAFASQDATVQALASTLWSTLSATVEQNMADFASSEIGSELALVPPYVP